MPMRCGVSTTTFSSQPAGPRAALEARHSDRISLKRFPGVDWSWLDRHFDQKSDNGFMHYRHQEYPYRMATMNSEERMRYQPPSQRVLSLLADAFSRWQDNWYFNRAQPEMSHLRVYLECDFGPAKADEVMALSAVELLESALYHLITNHCRELPQK